MTSREQRLVRQLSTPKVTKDIAGDFILPNTSNVKDAYRKDRLGIPYGEISMYSNETADSIASGAYVQLTRFDTEGESNLTEADATENHIKILKAGKYKITMTSSFSGTGSVTWDGGVFKNNGTVQLTNLQINRKLGASGDVGAVAIGGIADLSVNDTIEVWFKQSEGVNKDITVVNNTLSLVFIE